MIILVEDDMARDEWKISIRVSKGWLYRQERADNDISNLIDMPMFMGMLQDIICMKLGIKMPKTDKNGHNAIGRVS